MNKKNTLEDDKLNFKKEFQLSNFKNTQDIHSQHIEFLNRMRFWFLTVWVAEISFLSISQLNLFQMYIIL